MENNMENVRIIILAGGKGKRMGTDAPKVLAQIKGKPMIKYLLDSIKKTSITSRPTIVVGYKKEEVINEIGTDYDYVVQEEQLGTGHAVMVAKDNFGKEIKHILVLYGDHPLITAETIENLLNKHLHSKAQITMATVMLPDFNDWREFFYQNFSRIIRNLNGEILKSVEFKDTNEEEKKITEINPCYFVFETNYLWEKLKDLKNNNAQGEYYLTDLVKMAMEEGLKIESIQINPREAIGANSKEEIVILETFTI
ncbi:MAG: NTP transferase domain-containing protein [Candidatus Paceibacterota bacterium]